MAITIPLSTGVVAAVITTVEYILSTIAAISARATIHGMWLLGLHRGGEATLDARTRTRQGLMKDFAGFLISISLVIAAASVESSLEPTWLVLPYAVNSSSCVSVFGNFAPVRVDAHSPPFRVSIEPWVVKASLQLNCVHGISSLGVGSWTEVSGQKQNMYASTCVNKSLDVTTNVVGTSPTTYKFSPDAFNVVIMQSSMYTLFPLQISNPGKSLRGVGTAHEGQGECGRRGISGYYMAMNAFYETMRIHGKNMTFGVHERMCVAHGEMQIKALTKDRVQTCLRGPQKQTKLECFVESAKAEEKYSIRLPDMAALYASGELKKPSYACVDGIVQIEYFFFSADLISELRGGPSTALNNSLTVNKQNGAPELPVLVPISVRTISGRCQRTIAPIAQSALLFSTEQEWSNLEFAKVDRLARFHAYMTAVSDSLFPLPNLPKPESSLHNGTCYVRPVQTVTQIPTTWASVFFVVCVILVAVVTISAFIFRSFFRGESWIVGSARWSLKTLLRDGEGPAEKETMIQAVPVTTPVHKNVARVPSSFILGRGGSVTEATDWKYEFRFRTKWRPDEATERTTTTSQENPGHSQVPRV